jgi:hypothetical protein
MQTGSGKQEEPQGSASVESNPDFHFWLLNRAAGFSHRWFALFTTLSE